MKRNNLIFVLLLCVGSVAGMMRSTGIAGIRGMADGTKAVTDKSAVAMKLFQDLVGKSDKEFEQLVNDSSPEVVEECLHQLELHGRHAAVSCLRLNKGTVREAQRDAEKIRELLEKKKE